MSASSDMELWADWVARKIVCGRTLDGDEQSVLEETEKLREEQEKIEQRVSKSSNRVRSDKKPHEAGVGS